jgi:hypothetical protein
MRTTAIDVRQVIQPVLGLKPTRAKLGIGSFITLDFGQLSREDHHMVGKWHFWIYQAYWFLTDAKREIVNADSERRYIDLAIPRLQEKKLTDVELNTTSLETVFRFEDFRLTVRRPDYLGDEIDARDHYWMFFMPNSQVLSVGPSEVTLTASNSTSR